MEALRQWALCLIAAAGAGAFACTVIPGGSMEKTVKAISGVFVVAAICAPLGEINLSGAFADFASAAYAEEYSVQSRSLEESTLELFENAVNETICQAARECEAVISEINAELEATDDGIIIHKISVILDEESADKTEEFSLCVNERLGVETEVSTNKERYLN